MILKLIYPSMRTRQKRNLAIPPKYHRYPGLGLLIVAALSPDDTEIKLVDEEFEDIAYEEETDLVGSSFCHQLGVQKLYKEMCSCGSRFSGCVLLDRMIEV